MPTITYRENTPAIVPSLAMAVLIIEVLLLALASFYGWTYGENISSYAWYWYLYVFGCIFFAWQLTMPTAQHRQGRILTLDEEGLTHSNNWVRRRWLWSELSAAKFQQDAAPYVRIGVGSIDRRAQLLLTEPFCPPEIRIRTAYDTLPDEIIATLNEYRNRALGGAGAKAPG